MRYNFITIEGNIGSGKTTLSKMLSEEFDTKLILEEFDDNPFLSKFYSNPNKYAFPVELSFMAERYKQLKESIQTDLFNQKIISDYFFFKSLIFAKVNLPDDEYKLYYDLFHIINEKLIKPDLLIYLYKDVDGLLKNIKKRGRDYEKDIKPEYLDIIQKTYINFFKTINYTRILILDINNINFVENPEDYSKILDILNKEYNLGLNTYKF
jgi:deoxyguanosine kinase